MTTEMLKFFTGHVQTEEEADEELLWASREVLAGAGFSEKSDVYSFGIVLWEIMQTDGTLPYAGMAPKDVSAHGGSRNEQGCHVGLMDCGCDCCIANLLARSSIRSGTASLVKYV